MVIMDKFNNIHFYLYLFLAIQLNFILKMLVPEGGKIAKALKMNS